VSRHVVVGTAGHVDHGKTALVKALTGVDTDRWEEEKRRGITIDLGFAPLDLGNELHASVVDVPGHEDFVRNMVAGATGVDVALLVIAADEGLMPQTVEHLAILEFLGVTTGVVAVSKIDVVEPDWLDLVLQEAAERMKRSPIAWGPPVPCSGVTGQGVEEVRAALAAAAAGAIDRAVDDLFRLPVDRVFSVRGAGTVVTGTVWSGSVGIGDEVRLLPGDMRSRVRSIQVHDVPEERAQPGRRCALALPDVDRVAVERGTVVVADPAWHVTQAIDVNLTLLPESRPLSQRSRVRVHLGTAEVMARVTPAESRIDPGTTGGARLRLEAPLVARWGDRGVIRSYSPVTTVGGFQVIDPDPSSRPRRPRGLALRADRSVTARVLSFIDSSADRGLDISDVVVRAGVHPAAVAEVVAQVQGRGSVRVGDRLVAPAVIERARDATLLSLEEYHRREPLAEGMPREELRAAAGAGDVADAVQRELEAGGVIAIEGSTVRLASHRPSLTKEEEGWIREVGEHLAAAGPQGRTGAELAQHLGSDAATRLAEYLVRQNTAVRVGRDRYYDGGEFEALRRRIVAEIARTGRATPAELRDATGLTRKYLIPVLEALDSAGYTTRDGDGRRLGPKASRPAGDA